MNDKVIRISTLGEDYRIINAYLIMGEKTALIDSTTEENADELISEVSRFTDVSKIDYFIFTHTDHLRAGAVNKLVELNPEAKIVASVAGLRNIKEIVNRPVNEMPAKDGAKVDLGGVTVEFVITPNLGWPDTMMVYIREHKLLMSGTMFADSGKSISDYYFKELCRFKPFVKTALDKVQTLDVSQLCPSEGSVLGTDIYSLYARLLEEEKTKNAAVIFGGKSSGYTAELARTAAEVMRGEGYDVRLINCNGNTACAVNAVNHADIICFASPTIHRNAVPEVMDVISRIDRVNKLRTPCMVVGSYGWGGEALGFMANYLKMIRMSVFEKPFGVIMKPSEEELEKLKIFTKKFIDSANKEVEI
jgi:flavorubredoxin